MAETVKGWRNQAPAPKQASALTAAALARAAVDLAVLGVLADGTACLTVQKGKNQPDPATVVLTETTARHDQTAGHR